MSIALPDRLLQSDEGRPDVFGDGQNRCRRVIHHLQTDIVVAEFRQTFRLTECHEIALNQITRQRSDREIRLDGRPLPRRMSTEESNSELATGPR